MSFSEDEVKMFARVFREWRDVTERLDAFCSRIAVALDFDNTLSVTINEYGQVVMVVEWHGPYQAYNQETITFSVALLCQDVEVVTAHLKTERKRAEEEKAAADAAARKVADHQKYLELKRQFEPVDEVVGRGSLAATEDVSRP